MSDATTIFIAEYHRVVIRFPILAPNPVMRDPGPDVVDPNTFDVDPAGFPEYQMPPDYTLTLDEADHEIGHGYFYTLKYKNPQRDFLAEYWAFRKFPGTWQQAQAASDAITEKNERWQTDPHESWAEAFANAEAGYFVGEKTQNWGMNVDPMAARAFFVSLMGGKPVTRLCYDSTNANDIPADAAIVAGYVDGLYAWPDSYWTRFPNAIKVRIAISANTNDGHVLDVENGDATPDQAPAWVLMRRHAGVDPTCYVNKANMAAVQQAFTDASVAQPHYWLALYDNDPTIPDGCVAKQYANPTLTGAHYDLSVVAPVWPGVENTMNYDDLMTAIKARLAAAGYPDEAFDLADTVIALKGLLNKVVAAERDSANLELKELQ